MTTTLNKLIQEKSKEWKKVFPIETIFGNGSAIIWKTKNDEKNELKFLSKSIQSGYELGLKQPHNTAEGYCCACDYDIACMEDKIEREKKKGYELAIKDVEKLEYMKEEKFSKQKLPYLQIMVNNEVIIRNDLRERIKLQLQSLLKGKL